MMNSISSNFVENISSNGVALCYLIRSTLLPNTTLFFTPPDLKQQVGYVVYSTGSEISRHVHRSIKREICGTSEVLIVKKGHCLIDIYNDNRELVATRDLYEGDIMLMVGGGHGFRMVEDTVLLEIKQGPYLGVEEKERF